MAIDFAALIVGRKSGFTLPAPFYLDPEVFARDVELIFGRRRTVGRTPRKASTTTSTA
jgi:hypothetical protein